MSMTAFTTDFAQFCNTYNSNQNMDSPYQNLYNAYNTFLLTRKYPDHKMKNYRKNALVSYYAELNQIPDECIEDLYELYKDNVKDTFNKKIKPQVPQNDKCKDFEEHDDIKDHYSFIAAKYKYFAELVYKINHPSEDNFDDRYSDEYSDDDNETYLDDKEYDEYSCNDMYDEMDYDDFEDEYYSDDEYYQY